jgi:hypothetical protein
MTGEATWITAAILLLGGSAILLLAILGTQVGNALRAFRNRGVCPVSSKNVDRVILADRFDGHWVSVAKCSALEDPERVTCAKACVKEHEAPARGSAVAWVSR